MRANVNLVIRGQRVLLVPYRQEHVELYHGWMQDPVLQVCSGSATPICGSPKLAPLTSDAALRHRPAGADGQRAAEPGGGVRHAAQLGRG